MVKSSHPKSHNQQTIENLTLEKVMGERFSRYSKAIIQERALPDIRDGLKPVQRRILYAMNKDGNIHEKGFRKAAKSVGNVMGNFHPHGDSSIYDAMVRMSQDWKLREPLIDMHGNNGSMDGDPPAAMRYTEARLSKSASEMLKDIDKKTVDWVPNFDDSQYEPVVLPARLPNLLVNGATGISSGYATSIPPHNLNEIVKALLYLQKKPNASVEKLMEFIKGPDFPTGGIVQGISGIQEAYKTGHGRIVIRSKIKFNKIAGNKTELKITELPYEVNKAHLVKQIDEIRINKKIDGILEVRDESDREGLAIAIDIKGNIDERGLLNYLLKNTDLQVSYNFNMIAINSMRPERLSLNKILTVYLDYQREIIKKRTQFNLDKSKERQHIVVGLIKALATLNDVIKTVRKSKTRLQARDNLVKSYHFSPKQADAIVALQLYRLTSTDMDELKKESYQLEKEINEYESILRNSDKLNQLLSNELRQLAKNYNSKRKSKIVKDIEPLTINKTLTIPNEQTMVMVSHEGYLKRSSLRSYKASENKENGLKQEDYPLFQKEVNTRDHLLIFTNKGNLIYRPVNEISEVRWKETGEHLSQTIGLDNDEEILATYLFKSLKQNGEFLITTNDGHIKRMTFDKIVPGRTYKNHAITFEKLKSDLTKIVNVNYISEENDSGSVVLVNKAGYILRYNLKEIPLSGPKAVGVKAMNIKNTSIVNAYFLNKNSVIGLITQRGYFKKILLDDIPLTKRALKGTKIIPLLKTNPHQVIDFKPVFFDRPISIYTDKQLRHEIFPDTYKIVDKKSRGTKVINVTEMGNPVKLIESQNMNSKKKE